MPIVEIAKIQIRRGRENQTGMPQLDSGEFGWAEDTENLYIGKRIADGAVDDNNTRILTENDLANIFNYIDNTSTVAVTYQYRQDVDFINATPRSIQSKLDDSVSLADYDVTVAFTNTDITLEFQNAVQDLYNNSAYGSYARNDARRTLIIPAGKYVVQQPINLPPYARIKGEGQGMTVITYTGNADSLFKTVDADGNEFESVNMQTGAKASRDISIEGMTLWYSSTLTSDHALISLDNVSNAKVFDCEFGTEYDTASTTTYGIVDAGVGINIRGNIGAGSIAVCENIVVENCVFNGLNIGVLSTGSVVRPIIQQGIFSNMKRGIVFSATNQTLGGPINGSITDNRFKNIEREAIYIGPDPKNNRSSHVSYNNYFVNVGNGPNFVQDNEFITTSAYAVIAFLSSGNKTSNDVFNRRIYANVTTSTTFYYNPLVLGSTTIDDDGTFTATVVASTSTAVSKIALTGNDQMVYMNYLMTGGNLSRHGNLTISITPAGESQVTDNYTYIDTLDEIYTGLTAYTLQPSTGTLAVVSGVNIFAVNTVVFPIFNTINPTDGTYYLSGSVAYLDMSAKIIGEIPTNIPGIRAFTTDSANPTFDFKRVGEIYTLLRSNSTAVSFDTSLNASRNYVRLITVNGSTSTNYNLEYQVNIVT